MTKTLIAEGQTCGPLLYVCTCVCGFCAKCSCFLIHIQNNYRYTKILLIMQFGGRSFLLYVLYMCVCVCELRPYTTQNNVSKNPSVPAPALFFTHSPPQITFFPDAIRTTRATFVCLLFLSQHLASSHEIFCHQMSQT